MASSSPSDSAVLRLQVWADGVVRVTYAQGTEIPKLDSLSVVGTRAQVVTTRQDSDNKLTLATPQLLLSVNKATGAVTFSDRAGKTLLAEATDGAPSRPPRKPV